jgi:stage II sporulation protein D
MTLATSVNLTAGASLADELSGGRLLFDEQGQPFVAVGLMKGQREVTVRGTAMTIDVGDGPVTLPGATSVIITIEKSVPAKVTEHWVIETLEREARAGKKDRLLHWQQTGVAASSLSVGGTYGVKGTVVDTRAELIVVPAQSALPAELRPVPVRMTDVASAMTVRVRIGKTTMRGPSLLVRPSATGTIAVDKVEHSVGYAEHGHENRTFRGDIAVVADELGLMSVVNIADESTIIAGVLPAEMFHRAPMDALKAQAVTARGELYSKMGRRHFTDAFHVCSEQHCQVYKGLTAATPSTNEAAASTVGELAFVGEQLIESVYSASCGGHTEPAEVVWDRPPHVALRGVTDAPGGPPLLLSEEAAVRAFLRAERTSSFCGISSFNQKGDAWRWHKRFDQAQLQAAFADLDVGVVKQLRIDERGPGGRLRSLIIVGTKKTERVLRELPVRRRLGNLRSGLFVIDEERSPNGDLVAVVLHGAGFGHGSGMCQQGAIGMAEAGNDYRDIIRHYYGGAEVKRVF